MKNLDFKKSGIEVLSSKEKININGGDGGLVVILIIVAAIVVAAFSSDPYENPNDPILGGGQNSVQDGF